MPTPQPIPEGYRQRIQQQALAIVPEAEKMMDIAGEFLLDVVTLDSEKVTIVVARKPDADIQDDQ